MRDITANGGGRADASPGPSPVRLRGQSCGWHNSYRQLCVTNITQPSLHGFFPGRLKYLDY